VSEFYSENPPTHTQQEMKQKQREDARVKVGLNDKFIDIKDSSKDPTLAYVE
jgi:hypothetical protein